MPCYSTVTNVKIHDAGRLARALSAEGYTVDTVENTIHARRDGYHFTFDKTQDGFTTDMYVSRRQPVLKKYAELTARDFARKRGFSITKFDGQKMTLVSRR